MNVITEMVDGELGMTSHNHQSILCVEACGPTVFTCFLPEQMWAKILKCQIAYFP